MAAAADANAAERQGTAAAYAHRHTASSVPGLGGMEGQVGRYATGSSGRTPRRGPAPAQGTGAGGDSLPTVAKAPATAPARSAPTSPMSVARGTMQGRAPASTDRPIVSTGRYALGGTLGPGVGMEQLTSAVHLDEPDTDPRSLGDASAGTPARTPGAHKRKGETQRDRSVSAGGLPTAGGSSRPSSGASGAAGFKVDKATAHVAPTSGGAGITVHRTPRRGGGSRGSSRPVSATGLAVLEPGGSAGSTPRAQSSLARMSAHRAPEWSMQDDDTDEEGGVAREVEGGVLSHLGSLSYTDAPPMAQGGAPPASTPVQGARGGSRDGVQVAQRPGKVAAPPVVPEAPSAAAGTADDGFDPSGTIETVYTEFGDEEGEGEAAYDQGFQLEALAGEEDDLEFVVPSYMDKMRGERNQERSAMMELMASQVDVEAEEAGPHASAPGLANPAAGVQAPGIGPVGSEAPAAGFPPASEQGGEEPSKVQIDVKHFLREERSKQSEENLRRLGPGLFETAQRFWRDAYAKGGGPDGLARPDIAAKVKATIEKLCDGDTRKIGAFYNVEALIWADTAA